MASNTPTPSSHLSFGEHEVWITVDGQELECYGVERDEDKKQLTCWIPCEADKPFSVVWKKLTKTFSSGIGIFMDGNPAVKNFMRAHVVDLPQELSSAVVSSTEVRDFRFGVLEITDDDAYVDSSDSTQHLGEIKVVITKAILGKISASPRFGFRPETKKVHERSTKALTHQVEYGEKRVIQRRFRQFVDKGILATFIFKYRPFAMLQANGLVPRAPSIQPTPQYESRLSSPPPARKRKASAIKRESDDGNHSNDESDLEFLLERLSSFEAEIEKIRSKRQARRAKRQGGSSKETVKLEAEPKREYVSDEVIDLS